MNISRMSSTMGIVRSRSRAYGMSCHGLKFFPHLPQLQSVKYLSFGGWWEVVIKYVCSSDTNIKFMNIGLLI